ncbi:MAG TPA: Uma2 family endonuclease, partial [Armatimonadetes bacterium]|nr:Uma2 family endonuclease [Armatimonadota bacterium]
PHTMQRYEIVNGVMIVTPAPIMRHQWILGKLYRLLYAFVAEHQLGTVVMAPFDIVVQREPLRTRQPDLLFISTERMPVEKLIDLERLEFAPDIVVEIISPSERTSDIAKKLNDYLAIGVREVWLVNMQTKSVEVLVSVETVWQLHGLFGEGDTIKSQVLKGFEISVAEIFK